MKTTKILANHRRATKIRWSDIDANGFAHFGTYIRLMEETEYSFLRSRGLSVVLDDERGTIGFPRISAQASINRPLTFDEPVEIELDLIDVDGKQIVYHFRVLAENELIATGVFRLACCRFPVDRLPYAIIIPDFVTSALTQQI